LWMAFSAFVRILNRGKKCWHWVKVAHALRRRQSSVLNLKGR
jgi:hypothetical protein